jgi:2-keto-3-deoxy-L-rhamnonate aldolase RhmA
VPHVDSVEKAQSIARMARFGHRGRGYAGSTRWAGYATQSMPDLLQKSRDETVVIAQVEEPEAVLVAKDLASIEGIDGLFVGPADLSVGYGKTDQTSEELQAALRSVGEAARASNKAYMSFVGTVEQAAEWREKYGLTVFFVASEHNWLRAGAAAVAKGVHKLT